VSNCHLFLRDGLFSSAQAAMPDACQYGSVWANSLDLRRASGVLDSSVSPHASGKLPLEAECG
jgi:hypothetical protein